MVLLLMFVEYEIKLILLFQLLRNGVKIRLNIRALLFLHLLPLFVLFVIDVIYFVFIVLFPLDKLVERSVVLESCQH